VRVGLWKLQICGTGASAHAYVRMRDPHTLADRRAIENTQARQDAMDVPPRTALWGAQIITCSRRRARRRGRCSVLTLWRRVNETTSGSAIRWTVRERSVCEGTRRRQGGEWGVRGRVTHFMAPMRAPSVRGVLVAAATLAGAASSRCQRSFRAAPTASHACSLLLLLLCNDQCCLRTVLD
jgi:hypothetical protein